MRSKEIKKKYTDEELADAYIFPTKLSAKQQKEADRALRAARKVSRAQMSADDILMSLLLQLRFQIEDYLNSEQFDPEKSFSVFLGRYVKLQNKKQKDFATDIGLTEVELSQLMNRHRRPADNILIRLEIHSNNTIPALAWYKLLEREKEYELSTDMVLREQEEKYVLVRMKVEKE